jgi:acyl-CoA hydrolase
VEKKKSADSVTVMNEIVLPSDSNALGTAFGGKVMQWIDVCAAMAAQRHCRRRVVTAAIDELHFEAPIRVGEIASMRAEVTATFRRSLEVAVEVYGEDPVRGERRRCCSAFLTFTALDDASRPTEVPPLALETEEARRRAEEAEARRAHRLAVRPRAAPRAL